MKLDFSQFDAVLFDLDGTLVLTEHVWQQAKKSVARSYGIEVPDRVLGEHVGRRLVDFVCEEMFASGDKVEVALAVNKIEVEALKQLASELTPIPGAITLVRFLACKGKQLAICSSAPLSAINVALDTLQIGECFAQVFSASTLEKGKPDPEPYLKTLDLLGVSARQAMAVEDSLVGVKSAVSAGLFTVAVGGDWQVKKSRLADLEFARIGDIPLE